MADRTPPRRRTSTAPGRPPRVLRRVRVVTAAPVSPAPVMPPAPPSRRWPLLPAAVLVVTALLLGAFAGFAGSRAHGLRADAATNTALTDSAATSEVTGQITAAVNTIFSYDYTDLAKTQAAARGLLTGAGACQYDKLFATIREQAPKQKLVVTVTVTNTGVELLDGDRARLLVFATQSSTSAVSGQTSTAGAMFAIDARRDGRVWRITGIDTFTGPVAGC
jgi:Mce-associated membrane protein